MSALLMLVVLSGPQVRLPLPCPGAPPRPLSLTAKEIRTDEIHFESGSKRLTDIGQAILDEVALRMKQEPEAFATIIGYIDDNENVGANRDLDRCRASEVSYYLVTRHGIDPARINIQGRGALDPAGDNNTAEGRLRNRRVLIRLTISAGRLP
jgi:outer membrane protein OmpA-like peptidoglycan-associated protein